MPVLRVAVEKRERSRENGAPYEEEEAEEEVTPAKRYRDRVSRAVSRNRREVRYSSFSSVRIARPDDATRIARRRGARTRVFRTRGRREVKNAPDSCVDVACVRGYVAGASSSEHYEPPRVRPNDCPSRDHGTHMFVIRSVYESRCLPCYPSPEPDLLLAGSYPVTRFRFLFSRRRKIAKGREFSRSREGSALHEPARKRIGESGVRTAERNTTEGQFTRTESFVRTRNGILIFNNFRAMRTEAIFVFGLTERVVSRPERNNAEILLRARARVGISRRIYGGSLQMRIHSS